MNVNSKISLAYLSVIRNKKNFYYAFVMIICTILLLAIINFKNIFIGYIDDSINKNIGFRIIQIVPNLELNDYGESKIRKMNHIVDLYTSQYDSMFLESSFANEKIDGKLELIYGSTATLPISIIGSTYTANQHNVAICPKEFYPDSSIYNAKINKKNVIDGNTLLDKVFTVKYYSYYFDGMKSTVKKEYTKDFKIIGLYDSKSVMNMNNQCYIPVSDLKDMADTVLDNEMSNAIYVFNAVVDNNKNINSVVNELRDAGFNEVVIKNQIDQKTVNIITISLYIIAALVLIVAFFVSLSYTKKKVLLMKQNIGVLRTSGYSKKDILKLCLTDFNMITIFSFVFGLTLFILIYTILRKSLFDSFAYLGISIALDIKSYIYAFVFVVIIPLIVACYHVMKVINLYIVDLIRSDD